MLLAILAMGAISLASLSDKSMNGYLVNKLESERQDLIKDAEVTDMLILRAMAYETIENHDLVRSMRKAERSEVAYVTPITVVAQR